MTVAGEDRPVGFAGTAVRHHELGMIALAVLKRSVPDGAALRVGASAAAIDPAEPVEPAAADPVGPAEAAAAGPAA